MQILLSLLLPIGDTLFTTPAIHALRGRYPNAHITALVYPTNRGILDNNPDIDDFLVWPTRQSSHDTLNFPRLAWNVRRTRYDLSVEFANYLLWFSRLVGGIPQRAEMQLPRFWWMLPGAGREWRRKHAVEHYADVVRRLDIPVEDLKLRIQPSEREERRAQAWLDNYGVAHGELLVGIHPGGEGLWGRKRWSVDGFTQVANGLYERLGARIMLMGGKDDAPLAAQIAADSAGAINATGQTTLGETAALAAHCSLFLGNDSSPLHIAAASGTRVVGIYGLTDPRSYRPWIPGGREGVDYAVVRSHLPCACSFPLVGGVTLAGWVRTLACPALETISPRQVIDACVGLLRQEKAVEAVRP
jgi:ADP-heptose:LPS heptosyltransferase